MGCTTVDIAPAGPPLYYSAPPNYLPSDSVSETGRSWPTFWGFNLDAATSFTFAATATVDASATVPLPPLAPGSWTFVNVTFDEATFPTNPMRSTCQ